jgi:hypothetical protein
VTEGILASLKIIEGVSARTKYNVSGLSIILGSNPQFHSLVKQLYLKYGGNYASVPPEYQLVFLVATSSYICVQKNANKSAMNDYLNTPVSSIAPPII